MMDVPQRLAALLETLTPQERQEITAWFFNRPGLGFDAHWLTGPELRRGATLTSALPAGEGSQLVTIRLPADRHAELRSWCSDHGFTMAAVVRGLVERFLDEHRERPAAG